METTEQKTEETTIAEVKPTEEKGILAAAAEEAVKEDPKWFFSDGVPGKGDAPDWFKADKYKTIEEQAKAYAGLEKKLGSAPAEYALNLPKDIVEAGGELNPDSPLVKDFLSFAKSANLPQKKVDELIEIYTRSQMADANQNIADLMRELGDQGRRVAAELHSWSVATLNEDQRTWLDQALRTADDIYAFQSILQSLGKGANDTRASSSNLQGVSEIQRLEAEIAEAMRDPRYSSDAEYERSVRKKFERLVELGG